MALFAALYIALVYVFAPISFLAIQFRIAGVLRPAIAKKKILIAAYTIGILGGNLMSPFSGVYELILMPIMGALAGCLGYVVARKLGGSYFAAGIVIAAVIACSLSWIFSQLFNLPVLATLPCLFTSEQIICLIGACIFKLIETRYVWWN